MLNSEIIAKSKRCHSMARKFWRNDPDEIFNACWVKFREKELSDPCWSPDNPTGYFIRMMKNTATDWKKERKTVSIDGVIIQDEGSEPTENRGDKLLEWAESPPTNEDDAFLKNIITLALRCKNINEACRVSEMSRTSFWKYKSEAIKNFYENNRRIKSERV